MGKRDIVLQPDAETHFFSPIPPAIILGAWREAKLKICKCGATIEQRYKMSNRIVRGCQVFS
jgi:hypothetical protein